MRRWLLATAAALALAGSMPLPGGAQGIAVRSQTAQNQFPEGVVFNLLAGSDSPVAEVRLRYTIQTPDGSRAFGKPECNEGLTFQCSFHLRSTGGTFLIPKTNITYSWAIRDQAGNVLETQPQVFTYEDDRFRWESLTEGNLTVWFYEADEERVRDLLRVGRQTLDRMGALLGASVEFPVKVLYYASAADMQPAILSQVLVPNGGPVTLGEVVYSDTAVVSPDIVPLDILRHELTHVVVREALRGPFGDPPAWLNEGTAVYAQSRPLGDEQSALELAIRRNRPLSVRSLTSSSLAHSDNVSLFYGQSYSIVAFLIDTYGEEKFRQLFATFREGSTTDAALEAVYGFDQDGLEDAWRDSVGLPPRERTGPNGGQSRPIPQITPFGADQGQQAPQEPADGEPRPPAAGKDGDGVPFRAVAAVLAVTVLLAGGIAAGGFLLLRRR